MSDFAVAVVTRTRDMTLIRSGGLEGSIIGPTLRKFHGRGRTLNYYLHGDTRSTRMSCECLNLTCMLSQDPTDCVCHSGTNEIERGDCCDQVQGCREVVLCQVPYRRQGRLSCN